MGSGFTLPGRYGLLRFAWYLPRLLADVLAVASIALWGFLAAGLVDWAHLGDLAGAPWSAALLNPLWGPKAALLLAALAGAYAGLRGAAFFLSRPSLQGMLSDGTRVLFRRWVLFAAWLAVVLVGYLLWRVDTTTLRVDLQLHGDLVTLTLPALAAILVYALAVLTLPPRPREPYLPGWLGRAAGLAVLPTAAGALLAVDQLFGDARLWGGEVPRIAAAQLALLGVEACYLLAAMEALLADLAAVDRLRLRGRLLAGLGIARAGARLTVLLGPVAVGLWLAALANLPSASLLLDRDGRLLRYYHSHGEYRIDVPAAEISEQVKRAIDAIEDPGAYTSPLSHLPLNPVRVAGVFTTAAGSALRQDSAPLSGASGIAVQGCKNFTGRPLTDLALRLPAGLPGRWLPAMAATLIEKLAFEFQCGWAFERTSLLMGPDRSSVTFYLNAIYFGQGAYGIEAAALTYFGKPAKELTLREAVLLAGLPQAPSRLDPWTNPGGVRARRSQVLKAMVREGYITAEVAASVDAAPLGVLPAPFYPGSWAEETDLFTRYLMGWLDDHGYRGLSTGGYRVTISLDPARQRALESEMSATVRSLASAGVNNGAALTLDPRTGEILAWFGGVHRIDEPNSLPDMVGGVPHQPGSTIKPLLFACALEKGVLRPGELLDDTPRVIGGRYVANWDLDPVGRGMRPAEEELAESRNTAAAELVERLTPEEFASCLRDRFQLRADLRPELHGVELGLGLAEMPLAELAGAYTVLANGGAFAQPTPVLRVEGRRGQDLYRAGSTRGSRLLSRGTAVWIADALGTVSERLGIRGAATKTGTTPSSSYAVIYTQELVMAAWLGRAEPGRGPMEIQGVEGREAALALWRAHQAMGP